MTYLLIGIILLVTYLAWVVDNHGILPSWSDSYFTIKDKWKFQFVLISLGIGVGVFGAIFAHSWILPFSGLGLSLVGFAPNFRERTEGIIHSIGAVCGAVLGLVSVAIDFHLWPISVVAVGLILTIKFKHIRNATWWMETASFLVIIVGIITGVIKEKNK